jgi:hypothetical protein
VRVELNLEVWSRDARTCPDCAGDRVIYTGEIGTDEATVAVFGAFLYDHPGNPEVYVDATFGTFGSDDEAAYADHVTFGSRTGSLDEHPHFGCTLVTGGEMAPEAAFFGHRLTREEALAHPRLQEFWSVNDVILAGVDEIGRLFNGERDRSWGVGSRVRRRWRPRGVRSSGSSRG